MPTPQPPRARSWSTTPTSRCSRPSKSPPARSVRLDGIRPGVQGAHEPALGGQAGCLEGRRGLHAGEGRRTRAAAARHRRLRPGDGGAFAAERDGERPSPRRREPRRPAEGQHWNSAPATPRRRASASTAAGSSTTASARPTRSPTRCRSPTSRAGSRPTSSFPDWRRIDQKLALRGALYADSTPAYDDWGYRAGGDVTLPHRQDDVPDLRPVRSTPTTPTRRRAPTSSP